MLYLVSTPIGNLADMTFRGVETLQNSDYILCEDTRTSLVLAKRYQIDAPLKSFHQFSEAAKEDAIVEELKEGKKISLISDAGTPGISDPGERLVRRCRSESLPVVPIPGASAVITALSASGLETERFQFLGFFPRKHGELKKALIESLHFPGTTIGYESPKRIGTVLEMLSGLDPQRKVVIARELTKRFEEFLSGTPGTLLAQLGKEPVKGEITFLIRGDRGRMQEQWKALAPEEHVQHLVEAYNLSRKEAIKLAAELRGVPKRDVYQDVARN